MIEPISKDLFIKILQNGSVKFIKMFMKRISREKLLMDELCLTPEGIKLLELTMKKCRRIWNERSNREKLLAQYSNIIECYKRKEVPKLVENVKISITITGEDEKDGDQNYNIRKTSGDYFIYSANLKHLQSHT